MGKEGIFLDAVFLALADHDVDRIVQHAPDQMMAQLCHQNVRLRKMTHRHRHRAHVIMMTVGNGDGIEIFALDGRK